MGNVKNFTGFASEKKSNEILKRHSKMTSMLVVINCRLPYVSNFRPIDHFQNCHIRVKRGVNIQLNMLRAITVSNSLINIAIHSIDRHVNEL